MASVIVPYLHSSTIVTSFPFITLVFRCVCSAVVDNPSCVQEGVATAHPLAPSTCTCKLLISCQLHLSHKRPDRDDDDDVDTAFPGSKPPISHSGGGFFVPAALTDTKPAAPSQRQGSGKQAVLSNESINDRSQLIEFDLNDSCCSCASSVSLRVEAIQTPITGGLLCF